MVFPLRKHLELVQAEPRSGKRKPIPKDDKKQNKAESDENEANSNAANVEEKKVEVYVISLEECV